MRGVRVLSAEDVRKDAVVCAKWEELLDQHAGGTQYYQSRGYFDHLARWNPGGVFVAVVDGDDGQPIGIAPLRTTRLSLPFDLLGYRMAHVSLPSIQMLGGTLLMPQSPAIFEPLIRGIAAAFPAARAVGVHTLPVTSPLWSFLSNAKPLSREYTLYVPNGPRLCHTTRVPESVDEYFGSLTRKRRYNLKRQVKLLERYANGTLELLRIEDPSQVKVLHDARVALARQVNRPRDMLDTPESQLLDLAERGLLLSYVLRVNGKPCGLGFGTRFRGTLCLHSFVHDAALNSLSPGTVMQTLMMRDVIDNKLAHRIDYGFGASRYRLLNDVDVRVTPFLLRRGVRNRLLVNAHRSYSRAKNDVKRLLQMKTTPPESLLACEQDRGERANEKPLG